MSSSTDRIAALVRMLSNAGVNRLLYSTRFSPSPEISQALPSWGVWVVACVMPMLFQFQTTIIRSRFGTVEGNSVIQFSPAFPFG